MILAEPVGSCTDLVATVVQPLKDLYGDRFEVAPYPVLFKPSHGLRILKGDVGPKSGFSPKAAYIFRKQLEEADVIVLNRLDELDPAALTELTDLRQQGISWNAVAAPLCEDGTRLRRADGIARSTRRLWPEDSGHRLRHLRRGRSGTRLAQLHAQGDGCRAVCRRCVVVSGGSPAGEALVPQGEVAHLKAIGLGEVSFAVANLVSNHSEPELSLPSKGSVRELDLIVNARAAWIRR